MIWADGKEVLSWDMFWILLVLATTAAAIYFRLRRLRQDARPADRSAQNLPVGVEISHAEFTAMMDEMELGPIGDGHDASGQPFAIARYRSRKTGKLYDCVTSAAGPRVLQYPAPSDSSERDPGLGDAP